MLPVGPQLVSKRLRGTALRNYCCRWRCYAHATASAQVERRLAAKQASGMTAAASALALTTLTSKRPGVSLLGCSRLSLPTLAVLAFTTGTCCLVHLRHQAACMDVHA